MSKPRLVGVLSGGNSNHSALVSDSADNRFVVRIDGINPITIGLNRRVEWTALQHAAKAHLAPVPRYFNPELGCLVCDYLAGSSPAEFDPQAIASLAHNIHRLPPVHTRLHLEERLTRYYRQLEHSADLEQILNAGREYCQQLARGAGKLRLCHGDLLSANRLQQGERLVALDWEYACMAEPVYEFAVIAMGDQLSVTQIDALLQAYGADDTEQRKRFERYCLLYRCLEVFWYLALPPTAERSRWVRSELPVKISSLLAELEASRESY